jgi:predicted DNA-binding ribbon-helix-helix protein
MKSLVEKHSVVIAGRKTSVSLEKQFWNALREVAAQRNIYVTELVGEIKANRRYGNLSSAIRLFVLGVYRDQAETPLHSKTKNK